VATLDPDLKVRYWNRGMGTLTGFGRERALGADAEAVLQCLPSELLSPSVKEGDLQCSAGEKELKGYISRLTGGSPGYVIVLEDVTERKKIEEELSVATKHASVGRLAAGVAHEIGNPLASISSLVQELAEEKQSPFARESMETISHHVSRIARIVRNLGDFARITPRQKVKTSLEESLLSTLALVKYDKDFRKVRIHTDFQPVPSPMVDRDQIQQVFLNLMLNASDAMPGGGDLYISLGLSGGSVRVVFSDTGDGVNPSIRDKIFDPFFTTKGPTKGTGLGLGISYGIIKDYGGSIEVASGRKGGARFTVSLPIESVKAGGERERATEDE
jgi:signal transduction histidine kinase